MSILLIGNFLSASTGARGVSEDLAEQLTQRNLKVVTTSTKVGRFHRFVDIISTIIFRQAVYSIANIEVYSGMAFIWAEIAAKLLLLLRKPFLLTLHGGGLPQFAKQHPERVRQLLSKAKAVTTPSLYIEQELKIYGKEICYLPNGMNFIHYPFRLRSHPQPKLCWLRAFHKIYNPLLAVKVVALLRENFPTVHLTMIGPDKADGTLAEVQAFIQENHLEAHVEIVGPIPKQEVPRWLAKYDVFINTTNLESFGVAVMEAGAVGMPIVTTNVGELSFLWKPEEEALLVPPDDAKTMALAVQRILTESTLAETLSRNARHKAEQYDWAVILPEWEHLLHQAQTSPGTWHPRT